MFSTPSKVAPADWQAVDTHLHVFAAAVATPDARYVPAYGARLEDWQRDAQALGVERGVLVQPSFLGSDNRLLTDHLQRWPQALRGVAVVAMDASRDQLNALHASGVRGLRLNLAGLPHRLDGTPEQRSRLWQLVMELGWHIEVHTDIGALPLVLPQLPADMPLVLDHFAKPASASANDPSLLALRRHRAPVYVKLSAPYRLAHAQDAAKLARLWHSEIGPKRLLWGSDWPCTNHEERRDYQQLFQLLWQWLPDQTALHDVLQHNPQRLYWSSPSTAET